MTDFNQEIQNICFEVCSVLPPPPPNLLSHPERSSIWTLSAPFSNHCTHTHYQEFGFFVLFCFVCLVFAIVPFSKVMALKPFCFCLKARTYGISLPGVPAWISIPLSYHIFFYGAAFSLKSLSTLISMPLLSIPTLPL